MSIKQKNLGKYLNRDRYTICTKGVPNLKLIHCGATSTFKEYATKLQKRYTWDISFYRRRVGASECAFSVETEFW